MTDPTPGTAKAGAAGLAALVAGYVAKILVRWLDIHQPGFVDPSIEDAIDSLCVAGFTWVATYYTPHKLGA